MKDGFANPGLITLVKEGLLKNFQTIVRTHYVTYWTMGKVHGKGE